MDATTPKQKKQKTAEEPGSFVPAFLNGQTVAIIGTVLTVAVGIGTMVFASTSAIRTELHAEIHKVNATMERMRQDLSADINRLRSDLGADIDRLRSDLGADIDRVRTDLGADIDRVRTDLSADIDEVRVEIKSLDGRLRVVEQTVAAIDARTTSRVTGGPEVRARAPKSLDPADAVGQVSNG